MKEASLSIIKTLQSEGHIAVYAGGACRDALLGKEPKDYDIATSATPEEIKALFPHVIPVGASFGVSVVVIDGNEFEVATLRTDGDYTDGRRPDSVDFTKDLRVDASRRDFTINAMFHDPIADKFIDFFDGKKDIEQQIIRAVGNPENRIFEDKLRMMRAIRFASKLGFDLEIKLVYAIMNQSKNINQVSWERITMELMNILPHKGGIENLIYTGLLPVILPEVTRLQSIPGDPVHHPEGDVLIHSLGTANMLRDMWQVKRDPFLIFIGLIHDVGKYVSHQCWTDDEGRERHSHKGHDTTGGDITQDILKRMKMPSDLVSKGKQLVNDHMKAHYGKEMRRSTLLKFLRSELIMDQIHLQHADASNSAYAGKTLLTFYLDSLDKLTPEITSKSLISGKDLIDLGITPGPIFSSIINQVRELQDEGLIKDKEEALKHVSNVILTDLSGGF